MTDFSSSVFLIALSIFFGVLSAYFYLQGRKRKADEDWNARLTKIKEGNQRNTVSTKDSVQPKWFRFMTGEDGDRGEFIPTR